MGLDVDESKGMLKIGLPSGKPIFQLMVERLLRLRKLAGEGSRLPFLVMTSDLNHKRVKSFFEENKFFGMEKDEVHFFPQGRAC